MNSKELAKILDDGAMNAEAVEQLSKNHDLSVEEAYSVQKELLNLRYARGEKLVGG